ncbi:MAG: hypothetical protein WAN14_00415 [Candidatus Acidiferrales bacterium]
MRLLPSVIVVLALFLSSQTWAQNPSIDPLKDSQAVSVVDQAIRVAGGANAIFAIADYKSQGTITYHGSDDVQGAVMISDRGLDRFRFDSTLPSGVRSIAIIEGGMTVQRENGVLRRVHEQAPMTLEALAMPHLRLLIALNNSSLGLYYRGITEVADRPTHVVRVQAILPNAVGRDDPVTQYVTMDFFIDAETYQIVMTRDLIPKLIPHEIHYSDYRSVDGVMMPYAMSEAISGHETWILQLNSIIVNTGIQDSQFEIEEEQHAR